MNTTQNKTATFKSYVPCVDTIDKLYNVLSPLFDNINNHPDIFSIKHATKQSHKTITNNNKKLLNFQINRFTINTIYFFSNRNNELFKFIGKIYDIAIAKDIYVYIIANFSSPLLKRESSSFGSIIYAEDISDMKNSIYVDQNIFEIINDDRK